MADGTQELRLQQELFFRLGQFSELLLIEIYNKETHSNNTVWRAMNGPASRSV